MAVKTLEEHLLVDYACLFDLRFSAMHYLFSENKALTLSPEKYLNRCSDFLAEFYEGTTKEDQEKFDTLVRNFDISLLRKRPPLPTPCVSTIKLLLDEVVSKADVHPLDQRIFIDVNVYPLSFTEEECDVLAKALSQHWYSAEDITIVSIPPEEVTPKYLKQYKQFIVYDFDKWISLNKDELRENPIPSLTLSAPMRSVKFTDFTKVDVPTIVQDVKYQMAAFLSVNLLALREFSLDLSLIHI